METQRKWFNININYFSGQQNTEPLTLSHAPKQYNGIITIWPFFPLYKLQQTFLVFKVKSYLPKFHEGVKIINEYLLITVNKMEDYKTVDFHPGCCENYWKHLDELRKLDLIDWWWNMNNFKMLFR